MDYENFDIYIGKAPGNGQFIMRVMSSNRTALPGYRAILYDEANDPALRDRIQFNELGYLAEEEDVRGLGRLLRQRLFPDDVWNYFSQSREDVIATGGLKGLRIRLAIDPDAAALDQLPWEYLFDDLEQQTFIGLSDQTPIIRYVPTNRQLRKLVTPRPKVLVAVASPKNQQLADLYELEIEKRLKAIFKRLEGLVDCNLTFHTSLVELTEQIDKGYDVFQFMGHGMAPPGKEAVIFLEEADGEQQLVNHQKLVELLRNKVKLCVLTACESAVHDPGDMFSGLAQSLVRADIPAVIGMQLKIDQQVATDFTYNFYNALAASKPVDTAVIRARRLAYARQDGPSSWGIPVLYLQSDDGRVWPDPNVLESAEISKALEARHGAVVDEPEEARPKAIDNLLEALTTLNFDPQLNVFRAVRSAGRAGALVLPGGDTVDEDGLNWLLSVLIRDVRWKTKMGARRITLKSKVTAGKTDLLWNEVAMGCRVPAGDPAAVAEAVVEQLATHSMVFVVEHGRRIHMETLLDEFWDVLAGQATDLAQAECLKQSSLLLLILDEKDRLQAEEHDRLTFLPAVEPITESTFMTWHRASERLLPENMRDSEVANDILYGSKNGHMLDNTDGYVDDILLNIDALCNGILDHIGK